MSAEVPRLSSLDIDRPDAAVLFATLLAEAAAVREMPAFHPALHRYAAAMLRPYRGTPQLNKLISKEGRFLMANLALQLHLWRGTAIAGDGLTLTRLRALCAEHGVASPGRVSVFLTLMRFGGFVAPAAAGGDRRTRLLVPTARMMAHVRLFTAIQLQAIDLLWPDRGHEARLYAGPGFLEAFHRHVGDFYLRGARLPEALPVIELFTRADAGYMVLLHLFLLLPAPEGRAEPAVVAMPFGPTARRFGVSRSHVGNLIRAAAAAGFLQERLPGGREIAVAPRLIDLLERWFALQMALMLRAADSAAAPPAAFDPGDTPRSGPLGAPGRRVQTPRGRSAAAGGVR